MQYLLYWFISHLPCVLEEKRLIEGKEETCLILPTSQNQIKKGRNGNWMMMCRLAECPPNERMQTHDLQLSYLTPEDLQKSYDFGYHKRTASMGRVYEHDRTPSKKLDRTNNASDVRLDGIIVLSDIPKDLIFRNGENAKRYIQGLTIRGTPDNGIIYTGSICVDDIPRQDIQTDPNTGKKFISTRFIKLPILDTYFNTHQLIITRPNSDDIIEIGRFKEFHSANGMPPAPQQYPTSLNTGVNQRNTPSEINGIKF